MHVSTTTIASTTTTGGGAIYEWRNATNISDGYVSYAGAISAGDDLEVINASWAEVLFVLVLVLVLG